MKEKSPHSESKVGKSTEVVVDIPPEMSGLVHRYHDRTLVDDSLSDLDTILLALFLIEGKRKKTGVEYDQCKNLFVRFGRKEENFKANIYLAKKKSLVEPNNGILNLTIDGLKQIRKLLGQVDKSPVRVIKSGQNFTAIKLLEEFLLEEINSKDVMLCDPYVSSSTLFPLSILKGKVSSIKILTSNIQDGDKFNDYLARMKKETGISIEVKLSRKIHDRYLLSGDKCWSFGASIKDLGNKDTTIREINEVTSSMKELFLERWDESHA